MTCNLTIRQKKGQEVPQNAGFCPEFLHNLSYNNKKVLHFCKTYGADTRIRTGDLILAKGDY